MDLWNACKDAICQVKSSEPWQDLYRYVHLRGDASSNLIQHLTTSSNTENSGIYMIVLVHLCEALCCELDPGTQDMYSKNSTRALKVGQAEQHPNAQTAPFNLHTYAC